MRLDDIVNLALPPETAPRLGRGRTLKLRRAWPRSADHLLLEYADEDGRLAPAQWMRDAEALRAIERETPGGVTVVLPAATGAVMLQVDGADRKLKGLARTFATLGTTLVSHRPERRAVVRRETGGQVRFGKVVRRSRLAGLVEGHEYVARLEGRPFDVPEIVEVDERRGVIWFRALPGRCLHDHAGVPGAPEAGRAVGRALRWLHEAPIDGVTAAHDARAEAELLRAQVERLAAFASEIASGAQSVAPSVLARLQEGSSTTGVLHRDFYDKQIFIDANGRVALLDLDTLARGEPALDVANMLAHLELRMLQGRYAEEHMHAAADAFLRGYEPSVSARDRIPAYLAATRLRLACLYAWRPGGAALARALLARVVE